MAARRSIIRIIQISVTHMEYLMIECFMCGCSGKFHPSPTVHAHRVGRWRTDNKTVLVLIPTRSHTYISQPFRGVTGQKVDSLLCAGLWNSTQYDQSIVYPQQRHQNRQPLHRSSHHLRQASKRVLAINTNVHVSRQIRIMDDNH